MERHRRVIMDDGQAFARTREATERRQVEVGPPRVRIVPKRRPFCDAPGVLGAVYEAGQRR